MSIYNSIYISIWLENLSFIYIYRKSIFVYLVIILKIYLNIYLYSSIYFRDLSGNSIEDISEETFLQFTNLQDL